MDNLQTLLPSEIARLVLGYLKEKGCTAAYESFLNECPDLQEYASLLRRGREYPTAIMGRSLNQMLHEYAALAMSGQSDTEGDGRSQTSAVGSQRRPRSTSAESKSRSDPCANPPSNGGSTHSRRARDWQPGRDSRDWQSGRDSRRDRCADRVPVPVASHTGRDRAHGGTSPPPRVPRNGSTADSRRHRNDLPAERRRYHRTQDGQTYRRYDDASRLDDYGCDDTGAKHEQRLDSRQLTVQSRRRGFYNREDGCREDSLEASQRESLQRNGEDVLDYDSNFSDDSRHQELSPLDGNVPDSVPPCPSSQPAHHSAQAGTRLSTRQSNINYDNEPGRRSGKTLSLETYDKRQGKVASASALWREALPPSSRDARPLRQREGGDGGRSDPGSSRSSAPQFFPDETQDGMSSLPAASAGRDRTSRRNKSRSPLPEDLQGSQPPSSRELTQSRLELPDRRKKGTPRVQAQNGQDFHFRARSVCGLGTNQDDGLSAPAMHTCSQTGPLALSSTHSLSVPPPPCASVCDTDTAAQESRGTDSCMTQPNAASSHVHTDTVDLLSLSALPALTSQSNPDVSKHGKDASLGCPPPRSSHMASSLHREQADRCVQTSTLSEFPTPLSSDGQDPQPRRLSLSLCSLGVQVPSPSLRPEPPESPPLLTPPCSEDLSTPFQSCDGGAVQEEAPEELSGSGSGAAPSITLENGGAPGLSSRRSSASCLLADVRFGAGHNETFESRPVVGENVASNPGHSLELADLNSSHQAFQVEIRHHDSPESKTSQKPVIPTEESKQRRGTLLDEPAANLQVQAGSSGAAGEGLLVPGMQEEDAKSGEVAGEQESPVPCSSGGDVISFSLTRPDEDHQFNTSDGSQPFPRESTEPVQSSSERASPDSALTSVSKGFSLTMSRGGFLQNLCGALPAPPGGTLQSPRAGISGALQGGQPGTLQQSAGLAAESGTWGVAMDTAVPLSQGTHRGEALEQGARLPSTELGLKTPEKKSSGGMDHLTPTRRLEMLDNRSPRRKRQPRRRSDGQSGGRLEGEGEAAVDVGLVPGPPHPPPALHTQEFSIAPDFFERMLSANELHEKIAQSINRNLQASRSPEDSPSVPASSQSQAGLQAGIEARNSSKTKETNTMDDIIDEIMDHPETDDAYNVILAFIQSGNCQRPSSNLLEQPASSAATPSTSGCTPTPPHTPGGAVPRDTFTVTSAGRRKEVKSATIFSLAQGLMEISPHSPPRPSPASLAFPPASTPPHSQAALEEGGVVAASRGVQSEGRSAVRSLAERGMDVMPLSPLSSLASTSAAPPPLAAPPTCSSGTPLLSHPASTLSSASAPTPPPPPPPRPGGPLDGTAVGAGGTRQQREARSTGIHSQTVPRRRITPTPLHSFPSSPAPSLAASPSTSSAPSSAPPSTAPSTPYSACSPSPVTGPPSTPYAACSPSPVTGPPSTPYAACSPSPSTPTFMQSASPSLVLSPAATTALGSYCNIAPAPVAPSARHQQGEPKGKLPQKASKSKGGAKGNWDTSFRNPRPPWERRPSPSGQAASPSPSLSPAPSPSPTPSPSQPLEPSPSHCSSGTSAAPSGTSVITHGTVPVSYGAGLEVPRTEAVPKGDATSTVAASVLQTVRPPLPCTSVAPSTQVSPCLGPMGMILQTPLTSSPGNFIVLSMGAGGVGPGPVMGMGSVGLPACPRREAVKSRRLRDRVKQLAVPASSTVPNQTVILLPSQGTANQPLLGVVSMGGSGVVTSTLAASSQTLNPALAPSPQTRNPILAPSPQTRNPVLAAAPVPHAPVISIPEVPVSVQGQSSQLTVGTLVPSSSGVALTLTPPDLLSMPVLVSPGSAEPTAAACSEPGGVGPSEGSGLQATERSEAPGTATLHPAKAKSASALVFGSNTSPQPRAVEGRGSPSGGSPLRRHPRLLRKRCAASVPDNSAVSHQTVPDSLKSAAASSAAIGAVSYVCDVSCNTAGQISLSDLGLSSLVPQDESQVDSGKAKKRKMAPVDASALLPNSGATAALIGQPAETAGQSAPTSTVAAAPGEGTLQVEVGGGELAPQEPCVCQLVGNEPEVSGAGNSVMYDVVLSPGGAHLTICPRFTVENGGRTSETISSLLAQLEEANLGASLIQDDGMRPAEGDNQAAMGSIHVASAESHELPGEKVRTQEPVFSGSGQRSSVASAVPPPSLGEEVEVAEDEATLEYLPSESQAEPLDAERQSGAQTESGNQVSQAYSILTCLAAGGRPQTSLSGIPQRRRNQSAGERGRDRGTENGETSGRSSVMMHGASGQGDSDSKSGGQFSGWEDIMASALSDSHGTRLALQTDSEPATSLQTPHHGFQKVTMKPRSQGEPIHVTMKEAEEGIIGTISSKGKIRETGGGSQRKQSKSSPTGADSKKPSAKSRGGKSRPSRGRSKKLQVESGAEGRNLRSRKGRAGQTSGASCQTPAAPGAEERDSLSQDDLQQEAVEALTILRNSGESASSAAAGKLPGDRKRPLSSSEDQVNSSPSKKIPARTDLKDLDVERFLANIYK